jgi:hypothetical protein
MPSNSINICTVAALLAAPAPALAQEPAGSAPERPVSVELQALNPPVPDDLVLVEERRVPAEQRAAAYNDPGWAAPRTSWGHPSLEGTWSTDDMRAIPFDRPRELGTQEYLDEEHFIERARRQQAGSEHAENVETFHRNSWGIRSFGFSSLVVDPPNGRTPALTAEGAARAAAVAGRARSATGLSTRSRISLCTTAASRAACPPAWVPCSTATASSFRRARMRSRSRTR